MKLAKQNQRFFNNLDALKPRAHTPKRNLVDWYTPVEIEQAHDGLYIVGYIKYGNLMINVKRDQIAGCYLLYIPLPVGAESDWLRTRIPFDLLNSHDKHEYIDEAVRYLSRKYRTLLEPPLICIQSEYNELLEGLMKSGALAGKSRYAIVLEAYDGSEMRAVMIEKIGGTWQLEKESRIDLQNIERTDHFSVNIQKRIHPLSEVK